MKMLIINGSPKGENSNSMRLASAFAEGYKDACPDAETTVLNISKLNIKPCMGCFACWNKTPGQCVIADDMRNVLEQMIHADVIIWSFPLYYFGVPGPLKNLIDRQLPMVLPFMTERADGTGSGSHPSRYDLSAQKHAVISTCGFYSAEKNYDAVTGMFDHMYGHGNYETVFCGQGELFRVKELSSRTDEYLGYVREAGAQFAMDGGISSDTREKLDTLLYPKEVFEQMADASWGVDKNSGKKEDESLSFTRQMAALYNKESFDGTERVLEMNYTDVDKTYQIVLTGDGSTVLETPEKKYTTRVETPLTVWKQIARGEMRGDAALMEGKYRVLGDFALMIDWDKFFSPANDRKNKAAAEKTTSATEKKPSLFFMLVPWIALWVAVGITPVIGGLITAGVCALLPLLTLRRKKTVYDSLSLSIPAALGILAVVTKSGTIPCVLGYAAFGLMWLLSCFTKEPLCAAYVKYNYGGEDALNNPMFIRTNVIIAAGWGVLYLLTAVWTFLLSGSDFSKYTVYINNAVPVLMGIFTGWFEKWHPAHVAASAAKRRKA